MTTEQHKIGSGFGAHVIVPARRTAAAAGRLWALSGDLTGLDSFS
ncbi:hypothetical protein ACH4S9_38775 [Streptomyces sp. NPDC021225]